MNETIWVTGGLGFIGSNVAKHFLRKGKNVVIVDEIKKKEKLKLFFGDECNLNDGGSLDFVELNFCSWRWMDDISSDDTVVHLGAESSTTLENPSQYFVKNLEYSKTLKDRAWKFIYASSASVYGNSQTEDFPFGSRRIQPLNNYSFFKAAFDSLMQREVDRKILRIAGLRFFNVYGPGEQNKGEGASMIYRWAKQFPEIKAFTVLSKRDFVHVNDVVKVIDFFYEKFKNDDSWRYSRIYDVGSGKAVDFEDVARMVASHLDVHKEFPDAVRFVKFPESLRDAYQFFTQADLEPLRQIGYHDNMIQVAEGIPWYLDELMKNKLI